MPGRTTSRPILHAQHMDFLFELLLRLVFLPIEALFEWILENTFSRYPKLAFGLICLFTPLCLALSRWHFGTLVWYLAASPDSGYVAGSAHYLLVACHQLCAVAAHSAYRYPENWQTAETLSPTGAVSA